MPGTASAVFRRRALLKPCLTSATDDRDVIFKGIERSFFYEGYDPAP